MSSFSTLTQQDEIRRACLDVMAVSQAVYVSTLDEDGAPFTRAMFNLRRRSQFPRLVSLFESHDRSLLVYLATNTSSEKVRHLRRDPRIALYYCIPETFHGVMLGGSAVFETALEVRRSIWQKGWELYYPNGVDDPDFTVLSLVPNRVRGWLAGRSFDTVLAPPASSGPLTAGRASALRLHRPGRH
jgi:general stress protein 26